MVSHGWRETQESHALLSYFSVWNTVSPCSFLLANFLFQATNVRQNLSDDLVQSPWLDDCTVPHPKVLIF